jgi:hypothetical protein
VCALQEAVRRAIAVTGPRDWASLLLELLCRGEQMTTKKDLEDVIASLLKQGVIEIVGHRDGKPVYDLSEFGRSMEALRTGTPIEELRAMPALRKKAAELYPSLRKKMDEKEES